MHWFVRLVHRVPPCAAVCRGRTRLWAVFQVSGSLRHSLYALNAAPGLQGRCYRRAEQCFGAEQTDLRVSSVPARGRRPAHDRCVALFGHASYAYCHVSPLERKLHRSRDLSVLFNDVSPEPRAVPAEKAFKKDSLNRWAVLTILGSSRGRNACVWSSPILKSPRENCSPSYLHSAA